MRKKLKRFILGGVLVTIGACIVNIYAYGKVLEDNHSEQLDMGYKSLLEMDYEQAEVIFENIIDIDETNYEAYLGLADVYTAMDEPGMARKVMEEAVEKCGYGQIQIKVIEAEAGLRQFRNMAAYNSGFESVSGLTDFCIQGIDLFLDWIERAATVIDGISSFWKNFS